jgi:hypothetical protein
MALYKSSLIDLDPHKVWATGRKAESSVKDCHSHRERLNEKTGISKPGATVRSSDIILDNETEECCRNDSTTLNLHT